MKTRYQLVILLLITALKIHSQTNSEITKIVVAVGYCFNCEEPKIELVEIDYTLRLSRYTKDYYGQFLLSEGKITQEMWLGFITELKKISKKEMDDKKPFYFRNVQPIVIEIYNGSKSKIYFNDIEGLSDENWKLYESVLYSYKQTSLQNKPIPQL